jgi:hypothetical protein
MALPKSFRFSAQLSALAVAFMGIPALAAPTVSDLSLTFAQPSGVVGATDNIPVELRLTNNSSETFVLDNSLMNAGLDSSWLPTSGTATDGTSADFASYTSISFGLAFGCSGTFTTSCISGPPYNFNFASGVELAAPLSIAPGGHLDYLLGTFVPFGGSVAPGTYSFYRGVLDSWVYGLDASGNTISALEFPLQTCNGDSAAQCSSVEYFTRTVSGVPEPESYALMLAGLGALALTRRHRTSAGGTRTR